MTFFLSFRLGVSSARRRTTTINHQLNFHLERRSSAWLLMPWGVGGVEIESVWFASLVGLIGVAVGDRRLILGDTGGSESERVRMSTDS